MTSKRTDHRSRPRSAALSSLTLRETAAVQHQRETRLEKCRIDKVSVCLAWCSSLREGMSVLRGTRWALSQDSPKPSADSPTEAYSMTLEDKAPVTLKLFRTFPSPYWRSLSHEITALPGQN